jgi:hypothetical protein
MIVNASDIINTRFQSNDVNKPMCVVVVQLLRVQFIHNIMYRCIIDWPVMVQFLFSPF